MNVDDNHTAVTFQLRRPTPDRECTRQNEVWSSSGGRRGGGQSTIEACYASCVRLGVAAEYGAISNMVVVEVVGKRLPPVNAGVEGVADCLAVGVNAVPEQKG